MASMWLSCVVAFALSLGASAGIQNWETEFKIGVFLRPPSLKSRTLVQKALEVSDPSSSSYAQFLSQNELREAVGIPNSEAALAETWLRHMLIALGAADVRTAILAHGDTVTGVVQDYSPLYLLGDALSKKNRYEDGASGIPEAPASVNLLVTPPAPEGVCDNLSRSECVAMPGCTWDDGQQCTGGGVAGWICSRNVGDDQEVGNWECFAPGALQGGDGVAAGWVHDARKRRRRGKSIDAVLDARVFDQSADAAKSDVADAIRFSVAPRSEGLAVVTGADLLESASWESVEVSYRQDSTFHNHLLLRKKFVKKGRTVSTVVPGLMNMRPVDEIAICVDGRSTRFAAAVESQASASEPGCICDEKTGLDVRLGRRCQALKGLSPMNTPVDFVLPRVSETLTTLLEDLSIPLALHGDLVGANITVAEFSLETFAQTDLDHIREAYGLPGPHPVVSVTGLKRAKGELVSEETSGEGSLDVQVASIISPRAPINWWGVAPTDMDGFVLSYAVQVNDHPNPPLVHSISYGEAEALYPPAFVERVDYEFMKIALRGISMIAATGDNGISSISTSCVFVPDLIATSPWVTAVGATMRSLEAKPHCKDRSFEHVLGVCHEMGQVTCSGKAGAIITTSGYWSVYREQPAYQQLAVSTYLRDFPCTPCRTDGNGTYQPTDITTPCQHLSKTNTCPIIPLLSRNRAAPDVALPGNSYPTLVNKTVSLSDGTSASSPAFAGMVSLLNAEQQRRGEPPLGFLNPWLYKMQVEHPGAFYDVVMGDIGVTEGEICPYGYKAAPGWDPATGLGVPRMSALMNLLPQTTGRANKVEQVPSRVASRDGSLDAVGSGETHFLSRPSHGEITPFFVGAAISALGAVLVACAVWPLATRSTNTVTVRLLSTESSNEAVDAYRAM